MRFVLLALMVMVNPLLAQSQAEIDSGKITLAATLRTAQVSVVIHTVSIDRSNPLFPLPRDDDWYPKVVTIVPAMEISVNGQPLFVHRSAFNGLWNPNRAWIRVEKGDFILEIQGADGAESYFVRIFFDKARVKRFALYSSLSSSKRPIIETRINEQDPNEFNH